jgi:adenylylsulfate kinase
MQQQGMTIWFTGLSGAGKTTIGKAVEQELLHLGYSVTLLDGDILRQTLCQDLGFSKADREENIRRIGSLAQNLTLQGEIVLVCAIPSSFAQRLLRRLVAKGIAPYRHHREALKQQITNFIEVYVNTPIEICEQRDVKGLYKKARCGEITNFTGIDDPYEPPLNPDIECKTDCETLRECVNKVMVKMICY